MRRPACELPAVPLRSRGMRLSILAGMLPMCCRAFLSFTMLSLTMSPLSAAATMEGQNGVSPRTVTIQKAKVSVSDTLALLREQTGIEVADNRKPKEDLDLSLDLSRVTFWQAVDAIARAA